jgi:DeoR family transcriptional regulator of aga operon
VNRYARINALLDVIARDKHVDVKRMATQLGVSASTIRRDLNQLSAQQLVARTRGGAVATSVSYDLPIRYRAARQAPEKARIGAAAAELVPPGAIVGLNGGTTTTEVARAIASRCVALNMARQDRITIVTNAINIANELTVRRHIKLVMTGGAARPESFELTGPLTSDTLSQIDLDLAILGVDAFDPVAGAKALDEEEARVNTLMAARARQVMIVADNSKLSARAFARICAVSEVDYFITDNNAPEDTLQQLSAAGVTVIVS